MTTEPTPTPTTQPTEPSKIESVTTEDVKPEQQPVKPREGEEADNQEATSEDYASTMETDEEMGSTST